MSATRAKAYTALGGLAYWLSDVEATERAYTSALDQYRELMDREAEAEALYNLAFVSVMRGDSAESRRAFEVSLALARHVGRPDLVAKGQASLAISEVVEAEPRAALELFDDALRYFRDVDDRFHIGDVLAGMGQAHRLLAAHQDARIAYLEALRLFTDARNLPSIGMTLAEMATLESSAGRHAEAIRLTGAAAALTETTGASAPIPTMRLGDVEAAARQAMGDAAVEQALAEGRRMTLEEAVEYAGNLADST